MRHLIAALGTTLVFTGPASAATLCQPPDWQQEISGALLFTSGGANLRFVNVPVPVTPIGVFAFAIDDDDATDATIAAEVIGFEQEDGSGRSVVRVALNSRLVNEPAYAEFLRVVVCVRS